MKKSNMDLHDIQLELIAFRVGLVTDRLNRITPPPPPSINQVKPLSTMEKKLLPNDEKQELRQRFYTLKPRNRSVAEYIAEFDDLRKRCGFKKACENTITWFVRGLPRKIAKEVELKQHKKLGEVYECALEIEKQRALAKLSSYKPCTTMEQSAKEEVSVAELESTTPNMLPPPPPPPMSHDMLPPPPKHDLLPPSLLNQVIPPPPPKSREMPSPPPTLTVSQYLLPSPLKSELQPSPSSPTPKPQPHIEEDSGLSIEVNKDVVVCGEKGRDKEDDDRLVNDECRLSIVIPKDVERVDSVEVVSVPKAKGESSPLEIFEWLSGERSEIFTFKNYMLLRWENLTRVKMKGDRSFNY